MVGPGFAGPTNALRWGWLRPRGALSILRRHAVGIARGARDYRGVASRLDPCFVTHVTDVEARIV